jgi:hypothetical protein
LRSRSQPCTQGPSAGTSSSLASRGRAHDGPSFRHGDATTACRVGREGSQAHACVTLFFSSLQNASAGPQPPPPPTTLGAHAARSPVQGARRTLSTDNPSIEGNAAAARLPGRKRTGHFRVTGAPPPRATGGRRGRTKPSRKPGTTRATKRDPDQGHRGRRRTSRTRRTRRTRQMRRTLATRRTGTPQRRGRQPRRLGLSPVAGPPPPLARVARQHGAEGRGRRTPRTSEDEQDKEDEEDTARAKDADDEEDGNSLSTRTSTQTPRALSRREATCFLEETSPLPGRVARR